MKHLLLILGLFFSSFVFGQIPDTIVVEATTDTLPNGRLGHYIAKGFKVGNKLDLVWEKDRQGNLQLFNSTGVAKYAYRFINDAHREITKAERIFLLRTQISQLTPLADAILQRFIGKSYLEESLRQYSSDIAGIYLIKYNNTQKILRFRQNGTIIEIDENGDPIEGLSGNYRPLLKTKFVVNNLLPVSLIPTGATFLKAVDQEDTWLSVQSPIIFQKVR